MARSIVFVSAVFSVCVLTPGSSFGQAAVEYAHGAARAGTTAAPARGIGETIRGLADSFDRVIGRAPEARPIVNAPAVRAKIAARETKVPARRSSTAATPSRTLVLSPAGTTPAAQPLKSQWEDPKGIASGLSYGELVRRFGPPAMQITDETGSSLTYPGPGGAYQVVVRDEKVASVARLKS